ncbi:hypothetical protein UPYG_G00269860 [Umbra pygmaea]|uniref:Uncharacterized protein n=1 Tax=Umbra pygmaea TaxID=75934 RepID=A0ABD0WUY7_UMBPY
MTGFASGITYYDLGPPRLHRPFPPPYPIQPARLIGTQSRPLQYKDGVGGSERGTASSDTNTGNHSSWKCRSEM